MCTREREYGQYLAPYFNIYSMFYLLAEDVPFYLHSYKVLFGLVLKISAFQDRGIKIFLQYFLSSDMLCKHMENYICI